MKSNLEKLNLNLVEKIRMDFPILSRDVHGHKLVYLDNAASLQKPQLVMETLQEFYSKHYANVHRSVHQLSQESTEAYEGTREKVQSFLNWGKTEEIIFTGGTTHSVNLVSHGIQDWIQSGDSILVTRLEHHANFIPWQQLAKKRSANFLITELDDNFQIDLEDYKNKLLQKPKIVAFSALSNVSGVKTPVREMAALAKEAGAFVLLDAAQSLCHYDWQVEDFSHIDFLAFSSHKLGGPTGCGILWGKEEVLRQMSPMEFGGDMILDVEDFDSKWNTIPWKFEAGTPNFADVVAMGAALGYLESLDKKFIVKHEKALSERALDVLQKIPGLEILGPKEVADRAPIFSFSLSDIHPHDVGTYLDSKGIAVRAGHHCSQPLHKRYGVSATTRASFSFYNTLEEVEYLGEVLREASQFFRRKK